MLKTMAARLACLACEVIDWVCGIWSRDRPERDQWGNEVDDYRGDSR